MGWEYSRINRQKGETAMGYALLKGKGVIHRKIRELFSSHSRARHRVVWGPLAALKPLGRLADVCDVEFYSWGPEGLADPQPLAGLAERGVRINWVDPSHLRLYWVKGKGAVIGPGLKTGRPAPEIDPNDLALFLDAGAQIAVDEVLGPLLLDPTGVGDPAQVQESCDLLWRLAEGLTAAATVRTAFIRAVWPEEARPAPPKPGGIESALAALENRRQAWDIERWYAFLAEEAHGECGLLCFYDRPRSPRVEQCRRFFLGLSGIC
jgi:hypothetical protein